MTEVPASIARMRSRAIRLSPLTQAVRQGAAELGIEQMHGAERKADRQRVTGLGHDRLVGHTDHRTAADLEADVALVAEPVVGDDLAGGIG